MKYLYTLEETLQERFNSNNEVRGECRDLCKHGIMGGFHGFIYHSELNEFFEKYENEIEEHLQELGMRLDDIVEDPNNWDFQELRDRSVWIVVESWCHAVVDSLEDDEDDEDS